MPIRINLLAEAQAAEELRRHDPVKRATWIGALLVAVLLAWASLLQARIVFHKAQVSRVEGKIQSLEADHSDIVVSMKALNTTKDKLVELERLRTNRYLTGNLLDALQRAYVEDVKVVRFKTRFDYTLTAATEMKTNAFKVVPAQPATAAEQITVQIEALDSSGNPGDQVSKYKEAVASLDHLEEVFQPEPCDVRLTGLNPPQIDSYGKQYVLFTLECAYPEQVR